MNKQPDLMCNFARATQILSSVQTYKRIIKLLKSIVLVLFIQLVCSAVAQKQLTQNTVCRLISDMLLISKLLLSY